MLLINLLFAVSHCYFEWPLMVVISNFLRSVKSAAARPSSWEKWLPTRSRVHSLSSSSISLQRPIVRVLRLPMFYRTTFRPSATRGQRFGKLAAITRQSWSRPTINGIMHFLLLHKRGWRRGLYCTNL